LRYLPQIMSNEFSLKMLGEAKMKNNTKWPAWLTEHDSELSQYLIDHNIYDEDTYRAFRYDGEPSKIAKIDFKKFDFMYSKIAHDDPIQLLEYAPLWVRFITVNDFPTTVRVKNVMTYNGISLVGDLLDYTSIQLLTFRSN